MSLADAAVVDVRTASRDYAAYVGWGLLDKVGALVAHAVPGADTALVATDENVAPHYLERVRDAVAAAGLRVCTAVLPAGETHKNLQSYAALIDAMAAGELTRDSVVVALGGGVIGDMAGFAAATYMRGIRVVQIPTTLLSMVDSSVGGKTAIDASAGKNLVGAFLQPSLVVADVDTLSTLDADVFADGMGEVVKHGVLADPHLFDELATRPLRQGESGAYLARVVARNVEIKRDVVGADEQERGLRQTLNLGHTIGHAIEAASGYAWGHGHCVAAGLCCIARAAERKGWAEADLARAIERCVEAQGLPIDSPITHDLLFEQAIHDKKRHADTVNVVVPRALGQVEMRTISLDELRELIDLGCGCESRG